jgi:hypothetical protein
MLPRASRFVLIIALMLVAVAFSWGQRWSADARVAAAIPTTAPSPGHTGAATESYVYFLDVEGWYRITPYETVVRSPYDLSGKTTEAMAEALPTQIGEWQQVGEDEYIGDDPAVVFYLKHPTVALQRHYRDASGQELALAIIGNEGEDSFLLFSHTPETCYPGRLWQVVESRRESAPPRGGEQRPIHAQYLLTEQAETGQRLVVLFWYLWDNPQRDARDGVLSLRVNLFPAPDQTEEEVLARAWDFVRALFPSVIPWERF